MKNELLKVLTDCREQICKMSGHGELKARIDYIIEKTSNDGAKIMSDTKNCVSCENYSFYDSTCRNRPPIKSFTTPSFPKVEKDDHCDDYKHRQ